jgi:hypothetical protein
MPNVPIGYLVTVALVAWCTVFALAPPRPGRSSPSNLSYWFGFLINELPFVAFYWLLASTLLVPGAQHTFDLFHSIRFDTVVDAIEAFATWVRSREEARGA